MQLLDVLSLAVFGGNFLNTHDLDGSRSGSVTGSHIAVAVGNSSGDLGVTVLSVRNKNFCLQSVSHMGV